jgi:3-phenylpropionate/trans-cinnamate dioxygenase ferredoxin reductase subunit
MSEPILIIGAGEAGVAAAEALRCEGYDGPLLLISEEAALPYQRPPLSKELLLDQSSRAVPVRPGAWFANNDIELRLESLVTAIDPTHQTIALSSLGGASRITYSKLLIATGSRARQFGGPAPAAFLRTLDDGMALKARLEVAETVAIIGGGVIGLEIASAAQKLGKIVSVYEIATRLMPRVFTPCVSEAIAELHRGAGVDLHLGVKHVDVDATSLTVDGRPVKADLFVAGIGAAPNCELAGSAGCKLANGILVDAQGRTSIPNIYSAGDVACFYHPLADRVVRIETWQHAQRHGAHVGRAMVASQPDYAEVPWFWTDQHGINFQVAGFAADSNRSIWRSREQHSRQTVFHFDGSRIVAATTIDHGRDMRPAIKLIAAAWNGDPTPLYDSETALGQIVTSLLAEHSST